MRLLPVIMFGKPVHVFVSFGQSFVGSAMKQLVMLATILVLFFIDQSSGQSYCPQMELGAPTARARSDVGANKIATTVRNAGFLGRTDAGVTSGIPFEYPRGTGRMYLALVGMFIGGEVRDQNGNTIQVVTWPMYRTNPTTGATWSFEPVPGYSNPARTEIARSDDNSTWPAFWIDKLGDSSDPGWRGKWNGLMGKDRTIDGIELYYHYSDNLYDRWEYYPDSLNPARRGLGVVVSQRVLAWNLPVLEDAVFIVTDIYNAGRRDIQRAGVTWWVGDWLGGNGDNFDDSASYDIGRRAVYFIDADGVSPNPAFNGAYVASVALAFLQTPVVGGTEIGISNIQRDAAGFINNNTPDAYFWSRYMTPGSYVDPTTIRPGEYDMFASTGYFPMSSCASQRFVNAIVFSDEERRQGPANLNYLNQKIEYARSFVRAGYNARTANVTILYPQPGQIVSGPDFIRWNADNNNPSLKADIYVSTNLGDTWKLHAVHETNDGEVSFNPLSIPVPDGIFNQVRVVAFDSLHIGYATMTGPFTINTNRAVAPQIRASSPHSGDRIQGTTNVVWIGGDADGDPTTVTIFLSQPGVQGWLQLATSLPASGSYAWNTTGLPNASGYALRFRISSVDSSSEYIVQNLQLANARHSLGDTTILRSTIGTGLISVRFVNPALANGHSYRMSFSISPDTITSYSVVDQNTGTTALSGIRSLDGISESPMFDGMRIVARNDLLQVDTSRSRWHSSGVHAFEFRKYQYQFAEGEVELADYVLRIGNVGIDTSRSLSAFGRTLEARSVNFRVINPATGTSVPFGFLELDGNDGRFTASLDQFGQSLSDVICFARQADSLVPTWMLTMHFDPTRRNPQIGDTLRIRLLKPFQTGDAYQFRAIAGPLLNVTQFYVPGAFVLYQNYPNPFNPSTTINYQLPTNNHVTLKVFDILGREVATLINEVQDAGFKSVRFNASGLAPNSSGLASGVYLYRLTVGKNVETKKLILVR